MKRRRAAGRQSSDNSCSTSDDAHRSGDLRRSARQLRNAGERQDVSPPIIHVPRQATSNSLLSRDALADLHPDRGRFRSFLLAAARNFVCNEFDKQSATVRGGDVVLRSLDYEFGERQLSQELSRNESAEAIFERSWAITMLDRVLKQLQDEYAAADKATFFACLSPFLSGDRSNEGYAGVCETLQLSPEAARVAAHRMRKRYRQILREEIAHTTAAPEEVDDEIRQLFAALRRS